MAETIIGRVLNGCAVEASLEGGDDDALRRLSGRWEITARTAADLPAETWQITLRIEGRTVSGDVFEPIEPRLLRRQMRLGGRDDWRFSFWGTVRDAIEDHGERWLTAICDASHRLTPRGAAQPRAILSVRVAPSDGGPPSPEVRLTLLSDRGGAGALGVEDERRGAARPGSSAPLRRWVHLEYLVVQKAPDDDRKKQILDGLFVSELSDGQSDAWTLEKAMEDEGILLTTADFSRITRQPMASRKDPSPDGLLEDVLVAIAEGAAKSQAAGLGEDDRRDWTLALVLSDAEEKGKPHGGTQILGRAYGLLGGQNRFRTRFGAILHVRKIEEDLGDFDDALPESEMRRRLLCHYAMHELGHLLNLPHCWERDCGFRTLGAAAPNSPSYTNYASSWPFGQGASAFYSELDDDTRNVRRRVQRVRYFRQVGLLGSMRESGFDDAERAFIRHAPFDQIAQGGRTFLDDRLPAPALMPPSGALEIGCLSGGAFRPVNSIDLWHWQSSSGGEDCFPPIPALVRFDGATSDDFRFESAALQLLVRAEPRRRRRPYDPERTTVALDASRSLKLIRSFYKEGGKVLLPWLTLAAAKAHFDDNPVIFDLQVVYFRNSEESFASNIVRVSFERPETFPGTAERFAGLVLGSNLAGLKPHIVRSPTAAPAEGGLAGAESLEIEDPYV